ncbi:uncharacterized protein LOC143869892 isoform X2 [Tasmannia lanceolata]|uniref:uncharacterized protein LOC143869892 isoform X2 n=1 Tax=Tasmannia lanceolata TaxID=3420 RepID=UPI0040633BD3
MICTLVKGRMAAMVRLLAAGNFPELTTEEANLQKATSQSIRRELREADEANLLEEEDMHVFDCKPLTDPLHLVCCNACKRPVKASQYAAHAERCRSLNSTEDIGLELDGGTGHKKPPRKGRKKLQTAPDNQGTAVGEQERSESIDVDDTAASESNMDDQAGMASSLSREAKRTSTSVDGAFVMNGSGVSPGCTDYSAGVMSPSKKRTRVATESLLVSDGQEMVCGVATEMGSSQEAQTYIPVPLATKIYHSQRNHLRTALSHLYYEALEKEHGSDSLSPKLVQGNTMLSSQVSSPNNLLLEVQKDDLPQKKKDAYTMSVLRKPDQILAQSSELCLGSSGGCSSSVSFGNQFRDNGFSRSAVAVDTAPMGMTRTRYLPTPYSFPGNSGGFWNGT